MIILKPSERIEEIKKELIQQAWKDRCCDPNHKGFIDKYPTVEAWEMECNGHPLSYITWQQSAIIKCLDEEWQK